MRSLLGTVIWAVGYFLSSLLSMSCHSLLVWRVFIERSAVILMGIPLYVICCFSLAAFNICSLCLIFVNLINMCLGCFALGLSCLGPYGFLGLGCYFLLHFREVFNYYLLKCFLMAFLFVFFFSDSYYLNHRGPRSRKQKERAWENTWGDNSWKLP